MPLCFIKLPGYSGLLLLSLGYLISHSMLARSEKLLLVGNKAVLITGCDSGFGHALAKHLDKLGFTVFAGVLNAQGLGSEELKRSGSERLVVLQMDVTDTAQIEQAYLQVKFHIENTGLWGVVNNAGVLEYVADGEILPMSIYKNCMAVNFFGAVKLSHTFLPLLRHAKGRLVNVSSMAGEVPIPGFAAYGASKAALSSFSGVMRQELSKWGVKVATIQPGGFQTSICGTEEQWNYQQQQILSQLRPDAKEDYREVPIPGFAAYGASKAALSSFSGVMRQELSKWGVKVATIQPGGFQTSLNERGEPVSWQTSGWPARIIQHEMDHLNGVLYIDKMDSKTFTNVSWMELNE
ncbi:UNVERIFIED_CONTAM: hypothetical protein FKN15_028913 [Acipenser sinensis]